MPRTFQVTCIVVAVLGYWSAHLQAETTNPNAFRWSEATRDAPLDLSEYQLVFTEEFDTFRITDDPGVGPWFAPVHAAYGKAVFDKPGAQSGVYNVADGILTLRAFKDTAGKWHAGSIQTVDRNGKGFAQRYGYFEARIRFPAMRGAWCAFWLKSQTEHWDKTIVRPELDIIEWYGGDPKGHHQSVHLWPPPAKFVTSGGLEKHWFRSNYTGMPWIATGWHTHGMLVGPTFLIVYVDGKEVSRFPTFDEYKLPLYPLVSLTLYSEDADKAISPFEMEVDYVRIYAPKNPDSPVPTAPS